MTAVAAISKVASPGQVASFESLVRQYLASLPFSLEFQGVEEELADLAATYGPPGGAAFLATLEGRAVGCVAIRRLEGDIAELKRMFVAPSARGEGLGRALCEAAIAEARSLGYVEIRLDTVAEMEPAGHIYETLGFAPTDAYRANPLPTARFYMLCLGRLAAHI